jgi:Mat/Ecp fimbriae major subunit
MERVHSSMRLFLKGNMMNFRFVKAVLAASVISAAAFGATAANAASATATAKAKIVRAVTIANTNALDFGTIARPASGTSTVDVSAASTAVRTCGSGALCYGTVSAADFAIGASAGETVTVTVPTSVSLNGPSGSTALAVTLAKSFAGTTIAMGTTTSQTIYVGGSLSVPSTATEGAYSNTFNVTADY